MSDSRPNVLHLAHRLPYPPDKGDRIRSFHTLRHLAGRARVHLACLADEPVPEGARAALEGLCGQVAVVPVSGWGRKARALLSLLRGRTATEGAFQAPVPRHRSAVPLPPAEPGRHLLTATAADEWLAEVERLIDDEGLRRRLGEAGRAFVEEHHCWDRCLEPLLELLTSRKR